MNGEVVKKDLELDVQGGHVIIKGVVGYGQAVSAELSVNVGIVDVLEAIAKKTKTPVDDAAIPYLKMILGALEKK